MAHPAGTLGSLGSLAVTTLVATVGFAAAAPVGLPNPAAAFCVEKGGQYQIEDRATGARSVCRFPDGRVVDAWEHFRQSQPASPSNPSLPPTPSVSGPKTQVVDLEGRPLVPGFVDAHGHMMMGGLQALSANLLAPPDGEVKDMASLQETLRGWANANAASVAEANLIIGFGYDPATLKEQRHPTHDDLDAVSKDVPVVVVHQSGHLSAANSRALEVAGDTTAEEGRASPVATRVLQQVAAKGGIPVDVMVYPDILIDRDFIKANQSRTYVNRIRVAGAKLSLDGSPQGLTAWREQ